MKKILSFLLAVILTAGCLSACSFESSKNPAQDHKIQIVTTIFPEYDWTMNVLGDNPAQAEVTMLLDKGVDLHSFQPTAEDILKISTCDLFIYVGGESDEWVEDVLQEAVNKDMVVINLLDALGDSLKEEEVVEGMQQEEHDHEAGEDHHEGDSHDEDEEEIEYDEHVWLSLRNAAVLVESISQAIQTVDPQNAAAYESNADSYKEKLSALDAEYTKAVANASASTLLFGDRFPFRYLVDDYGLSYYAAFVGCSAETEADFETIVFLAKKVDELSLHTVLTIEGSDHRIAETIVQNTRTKDQQILTMDSMQSVMAKDVANGATYLQIMEKNLTVLKDALK
ncbi:MAG: zinc ABC transporter substrate-binding protein [Coriobacteriales bacterium]|nr:zinc ABC transporter substrate-binding protein [Coriobacteriales bacterium]